MPVICCYLDVPTPSPVLFLFHYFFSTLRFDNIMVGKCARCVHNLFFRSVSWYTGTFDINPNVRQIWRRKKSKND